MFKIDSDFDFDKRQNRPLLKRRTSRTNNVNITAKFDVSA
jgi:hypothetical protein